MSRGGKREGSEKKGGGLAAVIVMLFLALCLAGGGLAAAIIFMPSFTVDPYLKYVDRGDPDELALVYGGENVPASYYGLMFEDDVLLDMDFLADYGIDKHLFWDAEESVLTVSTPLRIIQMKPEEAFYTLNGEKRQFPVANTALYYDGGKVFVPVSFVNEFYQAECAVSYEMKTIIVDNRLEERTRARVRRGTASVRYEPDIKSDIAEKIKKGEAVYIYGAETEKFYKVRTENGVLGWIRTSDIDDIEILEAEELLEDAAPMPEKYAGRKLSLAWDYVGSPEANGDWVSRKIDSINIVSPTWLSLVSGDGEIKDIGSVEYVRLAEGAGYDVWPLMTNSFDSAITHEALKSTSTRRRMIERLGEIVDKYGVSGVNIDFESYKIEDGYYYTQFLRELCVYLRERGVITSVDLPVPTLQNSPTDREQIGKYVDYVMVMAYDQHWASSPVKGPVAGYDWVYAGIERTLEYVPKEKTVLGLPLYTRVWYQPVGSDAVTSKDFTMRAADDLFELRNAERTWEDSTKYYRGEYEYDVDGVRTVITSWLETVETLRYKAEIAAELELAGVACWRKGLENDGVWDMLSDVTGPLYSTN